MTVWPVCQTQILLNGNKSILGLMRSIGHVNTSKEDNDESKQTTAENYNSTPTYLKIK